MPYTWNYYDTAACCCGIAVSWCTYTYIYIKIYILYFSNCLFFYIFPARVMQPQAIYPFWLFNSEVQVQVHFKWTRNHSSISFWGEFYGANNNKINTFPPLSLKVHILQIVFPFPHWLQYRYVARVTKIQIQCLYPSFVFLCYTINQNEKCGFLHLWWNRGMWTTCWVKTKHEECSRMFHFNVQQHWKHFKSIVGTCAWKRLFWFVHIWNNHSTNRVYGIFLAARNINMKSRYQQYLGQSSRGCC